MLRKNRTTQNTGNLVHLILESFINRQIKFLSENSSGRKMNRMRHFPAFSVINYQSDVFSILVYPDIGGKN